MRRLRATIPAAALLAAAMLASAGCATVEGRVDPAMFPAAREAAADRSTAAPSARDRSAADRSPVAIGLALPAQLVAQEHLGERLNDSTATRVRVPIGRIVEAAGLRALAETFEGGVRRTDDGDLRADSGDPAGAVAAVVAITRIEVDYRDELRYFVPLGPLILSDSRLTLRLVLGAELRDPAGRPLWSKTLDSGAIEPHTLRSPLAKGYEDRPTSVIRLAHQAAWRLLLDLAREARDWVEAEHSRERRL
jgi:hypothetical protein